MTEARGWTPEGARECSDGSRECGECGESDEQRTGGLGLTLPPAWRWADAAPIKFRTGASGQRC